MRKIPLLLATIFGGILAIAVNTAPAQAQATRTWVSGVGDDANPCSRTAPCKTFAGAISKTAAKGEINVLDPGGFGAVTITKSISIIAENVEAGVLVSGTNGIIVNVAATDKVLLEGLDIEGVGTGINGVHIIGAGTTTIRRSAIRGFTGNGVNLVGASGARAVIDNSVITNNASGLNVAGAAGVANVAFVRNTVFDNNAVAATQGAAGATTVLIGNTLIGSPSSIVSSGGAQVVSFGNNVIFNAGAPTSTQTLK